MRGPGREERAATALLRLARARVAELQTRLADIRAARASAEASLEWLAEAVRNEHAARGADPVVTIEFSRFLEGAAEKRTALESTRDTLAEEAVGIEALLEDARAEMEKLERLIEISRRAAERRERPAATARLALG